MVTITSASIRKVKNKLYHYTYIPTDIAQQLGLGSRSKLMWIKNGDMVSIVKIPEEEIQEMVSKTLRKKK